MIYSFQKVCRVCIIIFSLISIVCINNTRANAVGSSSNNKDSVSTLINEVNIYVFDDNAASVIREIAQQHQLSIRISGQIKAKISKTRLRGTFENIMNKICHDADLEWFIYNGHIYLSNKSENKNDFASLGSLKLEEFNQALSDVNLKIDKFPIKTFPNQKTIIISGPQEYVSFVKKIAANLDGAQKRDDKLKNNDEPPIQIYKGIKLHNVDVTK